MRIPKSQGFRVRRAAVQLFQLPAQPANPPQGVRAALQLEAEPDAGRRRDQHPGQDVQKQPLPPTEHGPTP